MEDVADGDIARRMRMEKVAGRKQWRISMEQEKCCDLVIIDFFCNNSLKDSSNKQHFEKIYIVYSFPYKDIVSM